MSAQPNEVMKYTLDISDVETKAAQLQQLLEQLKAQRAAGQDTSAVEAQVQAQVAGLAALTAAQEKAGGGVARLLQQKAQLAAVVHLVGGEFGGLVSRLGSVTTLLMSMGPLIGGVAAALAAVGLASAAWRTAQEDIARARKELEDWNGAVAEMEAKKGGPAEKIATTLQRTGQRTPAMMEAAWGLYGQMGLKLGAVEPELAAVAAGAGITDLGDAAALLTLRRRGAEIGTPAEAQAALARARASGAYGGLVGEAEAAAQDRAASDVRTAFAVPGARGPAGAMEDPAAAAFRALKAAGQLGEGKTLDEFRGDVAKYSELQSRLEAVKERIGRRPKGVPGDVAAWAEREHLEAELGRLGWQASFVGQVAGRGRPQLGGAAVTEQVSASIEALVTELREQKKVQAEQNRLLERYMAQPQQVIGTQINQPDRRAAPVPAGLAPGVDARVAY